MCYDLPSSINHKISCSFSKGVRFKKNASGNPSPLGEYNIPSDFSNKTKGRQFTFGINWKAYEKVYIKDKPNRDTSIPGPGTYNIDPQCFPSVVRPITIKSRLLPSSSTHSNTPGPGVYEVNSTFNKLGKQINSKYSSALTAKIVPGKRFTYHLSNTPGPGIYNPKNAFSHYIVSNNRTCVAHSFGTLKRQTIFIDKGRIESPGPGNYRTTSDFGFYDKEKPKTSAAPKTYHTSIMIDDEEERKVHLNSSLPQ